MLFRARALIVATLLGYPLSSSALAQSAPISIRDYPSIYVEAEKVEFGVRVDRAQSKSLKVSTVNSFSKTISNRQSSEELETTVNSFKSDVSGKLGGSLFDLVNSGSASPKLNSSHLTGFTGSLLMGFDDSTTFDQTFTNKETSSLQSDSKQSSDTLNELRETSAYGPNSGFFSTGIRIRNLGRTAVDLTNIRISIIAVDPNGLGSTQTLASFCIRPEHNAARYESGVNSPPLPQPAATPKPTHLLANGVRPQTAIVTDANYLSCGSGSYRTVVLPDDQGLPPERIAVNVDGVRTDTIMDLMSRGFYLYAEVSHWDVIRGETKVDTTTLLNSLNSDAVRVRVIYPSGRVAERFISTTGKSRLTDLLHVAGLGSTRVSRDQAGQFYVDVISGKHADFHGVSNPDGYASAELAQGTWFVVNQSSNFEGDPFSDRLPNGAVITIVWMTKKDLQNIDRTPFLISAAATTYAGQVSGSVSSCGPLVYPGSLVSVALTVAHDLITPRTFMIGIDSEDSYKDYLKYFGENPPRGPGWAKWKLAIAVPVATSTSDGQDTPASFPVRVRFGSNGADVSVESLPEQNFAVQSISHLLVGSFRGPKDLPSDGLPLCFSALQTAGSFNLGRSGELPGNASATEMAPIGTAQMWIGKDPLRTQVYALGSSVKASGEIDTKRVKQDKR